MKLGSILGYLLFVFGSATVLAQSPAPEKFDSDVQNWQVVPVPLESDEKVYNKFFGIFGAEDWTSPIEWTVKLKNERIHASIRNDAQLQPQAEWPKMKFKLPGDDKSFSLISYLRVDDGWLGASNRGEFGSDVLWMSNDGERTQHLSRHYVWKFITHNGRHFAVEGIEHTSCEGSVIEFVKDKGKWTAQTFLKLSRMAMAVTVLTDQSLCVVTSTQLLSVSMDKKVEVLAEGPWEGFYPNSVVIDSKGTYAYIGMRQFVVRASLWKTGHKPDFLVPSLDFLNKRGRF